MQFKKLTLEELLDIAVKDIEKTAPRFSPLRVEITEHFGTIKFSPKIPIFTDEERQWIGVRIPQKSEPKPAFHWLKQYAHVLCDKTISPTYYYARTLTRGWKHRDTDSMILSSVLQSFKMMNSAIRESIVTFDFNYALIRFMNADINEHHYWMDEFMKHTSKLTVSEQATIVHAAGLKGYSAQETQDQFRQVRKNIRAANRML